MAITQEMVENVRKKVFKKIANAYLFQHIPEPSMDEDKLYLIVAALQESKLSDKEVEIYATTTILIQIALDTHELVTNNSSKGMEKTRQLTVLAGDYYSGHYYKLLADAEDTFMIKMFAEAIKEINEHKIMLYQKKQKNSFQLFKSIEIVEYILLDKLFTRFQLEEWKAFSRSLLIINKLIKEKNTYLKTGKSNVIDILLLDNTTAKDKQQSNVHFIVEKHLLALCDQLKKAAELLPASINSLVKNKVQLILKDNKV
ncbi:heptaprenyl diphosphate synthase component 1 [Niallia sp. 01092]|uniref:heptaprenyl diphosphate synthase component 1 n=1 Tax=unclassified Niallia TaxID=2837522 RepID=UPI003FD5F6B6